MKKARNLVAAGAVALTLVPFFAGALSVSDLQAQIQTLLSQIAALQQQIGALAPVSTTSVTAIPSAGQGSGLAPAPAPSSAPTVVCPVFNYTLSRGARGAAVAALQKFLAGQGLLTPDSITSFYGALTEAAVQNFQSQQGIGSSGDTASDKSGTVGKMTSAAIVRVCSSSFKPAPAPVAPSNGSACTAISISCPAGKVDQVGPNCSHTCVAVASTTPTSVTSCRAYPPPTDPCATSWKPNVDANGCVVSYSCSATTTTQSTGTATSCPVYSMPSCISGYIPQWQGNDSRGCTLGYQCVAL